jgi:hypothetical protein
MTTKGLSSTEISDIIKTCGIYRVSRIKMPGLEVEFHSSGAQGQGADQIQILERQIEAVGPRTVETGGEKLQTQTEQEKRRELEEFFEAQRLIDDPLAHEEAMVDELLQKGNA